MFRLFTTWMRRDLKDIFHENVSGVHSSANSHIPPKRAASSEHKTPRVQSRLESVCFLPYSHKSSPIPFQMSSCPSSNEFVPDDILTRNSALHLCHVSNHQLSIYNALVKKGLCSFGPMDTSRSSVNHQAYSPNPFTEFSSF